MRQKPTKPGHTHFGHDPLVSDTITAAYFFTKSLADRWRQLEPSVFSQEGAEASVLLLKVWVGKLVHLHVCHHVGCI
ncbi:hypothetical protein KIN_04750 [Litoreibacter roseus]|uniref:Uncharacterized protein n=1 Tax=Litoreibacter roseus TaxID=2601869 RepID=A0A6N6JAY6_9RHOB|nr:hypothetical protein KIN_04750 [Litoreibacter roseus]